MKRAILFLLIFLLLSLARPVGAYEVSRFAAKLEVGAGARLHVVETIHVNFGPERHHTICRALPIVVMDASGNRQPLAIKLIAVTDGSGKAWPVRVERSGRYLQVWMGSEQAFTTGEQVYELVYDVDGAVWQGPARDELHWEVTGDAWDVVVIGVEADVAIPEGASPDAVDAGSRVSRFGRVSREADVKMVDAEHARFVLSRGLLPSEELEISVVWPAGLVRHPGLAARVGRFVTRNPVMVAIAVLGVALLLALRRRVAARRGSGVDAAGVGGSSAEAAFLHDGELHAEHATALLIDLAERGAVAIEWPDGQEPVLVDRRRGGAAADLAGYEDKFLDAVFAGSDRRALTAPDVSVENAALALARDVEAALIEGGYLEPPMSSPRSPFLLMAAIVFVGAVVATYAARRATSGLAGMVAGEDWVAAIIASLVAGALVLGLGAVRPRLTQSGRGIVEWWRERVAGVRMAALGAGRGAAPVQDMTLLPVAIAECWDAEWIAAAPMVATPPWWARPGVPEAAVREQIPGDLLHVIRILNGMTSGGGGI